jgi:transcriptional regulator with XRE-family HTH domain
MTKLRKTISQNLSQVRTARGLSQSDLAKSAGLMPSAIAHFESGRRLPSCENLLKLSNALEVSIDELFGKRISNWIATPSNQ